MNHWKALVALILLVMLALPATHAAASVGKVMYTFGKVTVETPAVEVLIKGDSVDAGNVIVTGPKGYVQLLLDDGTKIAIRPASRFVIEALEMPAEDGQPIIGEGKVLKASFNLQQGGFRTITGKIAQRNPGAYQVSTPSAVIGVRGTDYTARMCAADCGSGSDGLYVGVSDGGVTLTNNGGELSLGKNEYGFAAGFNTPPAALLAPPASLQDDGMQLLEEEAEEESSDDSSAEEEGEGETEGETEGEGDAAADEAASDEAASDETATDETASDETASDEAASDESSGGESSSDESSGGESSSDSSSGDDSSSTDSASENSGDAAGDDSSATASAASSADSDSSGGDEGAAGSSTATTSSSSDTVSSGDSGGEGGATSTAATTTATTAATTTAAASTGSSSGDSSSSSSSSAGTAGTGSTAVTQLNSEFGATGTVRVASTAAPTTATAAASATTTATTPSTAMATQTKAAEVVVQEIVVTTTSGDLVVVSGGTPVSTPRGLAYTRVSGAASLNGANESMKFDTAGNLTAFTDNSVAVSQAFAIGTAVNKNAGVDVANSLKWGRWTQGVATQVDGTTRASTNLDLANRSLHWLTGPLTGPIQIITGTANYVLVGNTDPTNSTGAVGILGSANLSANFTAATVTSSVQLGIANQVWKASGTGTINADLFKGLYDTVTVGGVAGGSGSFGGIFTNYTAVAPQGAGLTYQLINGAQKVDGVAIFKAAP